MRTTLIVAASLLTFALTIAQDSSVEIQGNREDIKWNAFNVFINLGGFIATCLSPAGLTGVALPLCALTTVASFSTIVCLGLKIFDGLITKDNELSPQMIVFLHGIGMEVQEQQALAEFTGQVQSSMWDPWAESRTAVELRQLQPRVAYSLEKYLNSVGIERPSYCLSFQIDEQSEPYDTSRLQQKVCFTDYSADAFGESKPTKVPLKAATKVLRRLHRSGIGLSFEQTRELVGTIYTTFGTHGKEFMEKTLILVENIGAAGESLEPREFSITDQVNGAEELLLKVQVSTALNSSL
ncbi:LAQU0S12e02960g1_1 [Lachancea quebecensis]|uniref:LAQU0S12e02960g1_1 n=1 Tax=Lachancea quebecensis TaxID=1654605 RepID=A0A0N7MM26_9SACH|nr:LAQU0S12e02960g1_1 [Lachancea quebecensis]